MKYRFIISSVFMVFVLRVLSQNVQQEAIQLYEQGKYEEAISSLHKEKANDENDQLETKCYLNLINEQSESIIQREKYYEKMILKLNELQKRHDAEWLKEKLEDNLVETQIVLQNQGIDNYNQNKLKSAFANLQMAYGINDQLGVGDTSLAYTISVVAYELNDLQNTQLYLKKGIKIGLKNKQTFYNLFEICKQEKDNKDMQEYLNLALYHYPNDRILINEELNYFVKFGDFEKAISKLKQRLVHQPNDIEWILLLASLYENTGDIEKSEQNYKKVLQIDDSNLKAIISIGKLNLESAIFYEQIKTKSAEYITESRKYLEKAYALTPDDVMVLQHLSQLYSFSGEFEKYEKVKKKLEMLQ